MLNNKPHFIIHSQLIIFRGDGCQFFSAIFSTKSFGKKLIVVVLPSVSIVYQVPFEISNSGWSGDRYIDCASWLFGDIVTTAGSPPFHSTVSVLSLWRHEI